MRLAPLLVPVVLAAGCAGTTLVRVAIPDGRAGAPHIRQLVDLGALPLPATGPVSTAASDGRFTPGEIVAVVGEHLSASPRVDVDGRPVELVGHLTGGSLLVRLPRGLDPAIPHGLRVTTAGGEATTPVQVQSYVVAADTGAGVVRVLTVSGRDAATFGEDVREVALPRAKFVAISPSGAFAYVLQTPKKDDSGACHSELLVLHLGAAGGPRELARTLVDTSSPGAWLLPLDDDTLVVVGERDLVVLDDLLAAKPRVRGRLEAPKAPAKQAWLDALLLDGGRRAALLDGWDNRLDLVDLASLDSPRLVHSLALAPAGALPAVVDLAAGPAGRFWVLTGPNYRLAGRTIQRAATAVANGARELAGVKPAATTQAPVLETVPARVLGVRLAGDGASRRLELDGKPTALPADFHPLFGRDTGERLLVSGVSTRALDFSEVDLSLDGVRALVRSLGDTVQLGRLVAVDRDGAARVQTQGLALYFDLDLLPSGQMVYGIVRIGPKVLPPSLAVDWGVEAGPGSYRKLRSLESKAVIPPYSYGLIAAQ